MYDTNLTSNDIERETDKAYLVRVPVGMSALNDRMVWIPKSQVQWIAQGCEAATMHIPEWLAGKL
jgi:hypothetical protein